MAEKIDKQREKELLHFCKKVNIKFKDLSLLEQAFHHRSLINETKSGQNNERLEFLGDSVLGVVTATYLYKNLSNPEGDLAKIKSAVVSEKSLAPIALSLGIDKLIELGHGEELSGGRTKPAILADCMEAIIGAYYLDSGYKNTEIYVLNFIIPEIEKVLTNGLKDFKSKLQELSQQKFHVCPEYILLKVSGPDHDKVFTVNVVIGENTYGPKTGKNKKEAEQSCAKLALEILDRNN